MNLGAILTVFRKELRETLRDRRALVTMFLLPTVVMPAIILGFGFAAGRVIGKARAEVPSVMLVGAEASPRLRDALAAERGLRLVPSAADYLDQVADKRVRAAVRVPEDFDARLAAGTPAAVRIFLHEGDLKSGFAAAELERFFRVYRDDVVQGRLGERGLPPTLLRPFTVARQNVAPPAEVGGSLIGGFIPYLIILLCFTGAMYPAMDLTAGEKERGTMETLLCTPVARLDLVLGKFLLVLGSSLATVVLAGLSALVTLPLGRLLLVHATGDLPAAGAAAEGLVVDPLGLLACLVLIVPVAVLFAAVIFSLALYARSQKEAQSLISPLIVVVLLPALAGLLPGLELRPGLALVPLLNVSLACKALASGIFDWGSLALIFLSTSAYAAAALAFAARLFGREDVVLRT